MKILLSIIFILLPLSISSKEIILKCTNSENHIYKENEGTTIRYFRYSKGIFSEAKIESRGIGKWYEWCENKEEYLEFRFQDNKRINSGKELGLDVRIKYSQEFKLLGLGGMCSVKNKVSSRGKDEGLCDVWYAIDFEFPKRIVRYTCHSFAQDINNDKDVQNDKGWECSQVKKVTQE
tara:strand:- start:142 stop:675 length:534 start_codon:yes stop_codon:yes gene_type:complete